MCGDATMWYEKIVNWGIWGMTILFFLISFILEFRIDKLVFTNGFAFLRGHRDFIINIFLGGFASGVITGVTTWFALNNKKLAVKEKINRYLYDVHKYFNEYCNAIAQKDYKVLCKCVSDFENVMTDFQNCIYSNEYTDKRYKDIEKAYCNKIIQYSTKVFICETYFKNVKVLNEQLLFDDMSNGILLGVKDEFNQLVEKCIGLNSLKRTDISDDEIANHIENTKERYTLKEDTEENIM